MTYKTFTSDAVVTDGPAGPNPCQRPERRGSENKQASRWLEDTANVRRHGTTGERPVDRFERDERGALRPLASRPVDEGGHRRQDTLSPWLSAVWHVIPVSARPVVRNAAATWPLRNWSHLGVRSATTPRRGGGAWGPGAARRRARWVENLSSPVQVYLIGGPSNGRQIRRGGSGLNPRTSVVDPLAL